MDPKHTYAHQPQFMPKRQTRELGKFKISQPRKFITNLYQVTLHNSLNKICLYQAKFPAQIPDDSRQVIAKCMNQIKGDLRTKIGFICFTGKLVYGFKVNKENLFYQSKNMGNTIAIEIKFIKELQVTELLKDPKTRSLVFHFLNSKLKGCLRNANICQLGRVGQFYQKDQLLSNFSTKDMHNEYYNLQAAGMNVLRGYKFTLVMINNALKLQLDVCSRVLQKHNLLQDFTNFIGSKDQLINYYTGATIITRYGNYRTYKIQQIDFSLSPLSTFNCQGVQVNFVQYFKKSYNLEIFHMRQPLIKVIGRKKRQFTKKLKKIQEIKQYIFLVPQLVSLTGMKDQQRANFESMKALAPFTKLDPNTRFNESYKILGTLNQAKDTIQIGSQQTLNGYLLPEPIIRFQQIANIKSGSITNRGNLLKSHYFNHWIFAYSVSMKKDFDQAVSAENYLRQASEAYNIRFNQPIYVQIQGQKSNPRQFCDRIIDSVKIAHVNKKKIQLVFIILKPKQVNYYGQIKNVLTNQLGIPCQVMQAKTLNKGKGILSIASKIAIQMSCKAGDSPWKVQNKIGYFQNRNFAYCSITSSSKGKGGSTVSFVGTTNNQCTRVYSSYVLKVQRRQKIEGIFIVNWFVGWMKAYYLGNKKSLPQTLIIYRESSGESMLKHLINHQMHMISTAIKQVQEKTKKPTFNPQIIYVVVNKNITSRFFAMNRNQLYNPEPGSIIVDQMSIDNRFDFHLVAQKVNQGTSTPTHYIVGYDSSKISQEDLIRFTYQQCYNYYNWQGSVKVPACVQCANKLSKLAGESIKKKFVDLKSTELPPINESFYFL